MISQRSTDARVPEFMDVFMQARENMRNQMRTGLTWLDDESKKRFAKPFAECTDAQRKAFLDDIAWPRRARQEMQAGVRFFNFFRNFTASGFWSSKMGMEDLQYLGNTFVREWSGCPQEALKKLGGEVTDVVAYRTVLEEAQREGDPDVYGMLLEGRIDVVTFTSASAVRNFAKIYGADAAAVLERGDAEDVVDVAVGQEDAADAPARLRQGQHPRDLGARVHEHGLAGLAAGGQVGVHGERPDDAVEVGRRAGGRATPGAP